MKSIRLPVAGVLALVLIGCNTTNRAQLPGYEPEVIASLDDLESITDVYAGPLKQFHAEPTVANFSRQFPGHHRLPNQGKTARYQIYLDQRYVLKRDDDIVELANAIIVINNLLNSEKFDNQDQVETSPRLYRQYLTFAWEDDTFLGHTLAERHCTSDRVNTLNCEY
ncbi:hypothetical protein KUV89_12105 [Marinobacter hydrocarbonoclasticus]|nr:hypothetical protein [Marinobacter nauticus]